jgi:hypothetical protein
MDDGIIDVNRHVIQLLFRVFAITSCLVFAPFTAFLYGNREFVTIGNIWRYPIVATMIAVLCGVCVAAIYGRLWGTRITLICGWGVFALFLYRNVEGMVERYLPFLNVPAELLWILLLLVGVTAITQLAERSTFLTPILLFSLTLSVLPLAQYWYVGQNAGSGLREGFATTSEDVWPVKPDIYYLILDGLARTDVFESIYGFDFKSFDEVLRREGFVIADRALGAHPMTWLSVPAVLDQEYQAVPGPRGRPATHARTDRIMSGNSQTHEELVAQGYRFVTATEGGGPFCDLSLSPVRDLTTCLVQGNSIDAAIRLEFAKLTPLHGLANRGLLPSVLSRWLAAEDLRWTSENTTGRTFLVDDLLRTVALAQGENMGAPVFVLAHMLYPHPPFTLDSECGPSSHPGFRPSVDAWDDLVGLRMGAECTQKQVLQLISEVDRDAVIVLQSDHGPGRGLLRDGKHVQNVPIEDLWTRASVYSAVRLPERCRYSVPDTYAGTNTFPVVFNCLSGGDLTFEPARSLWAWYEGREVRDVTNRLRAYEDSLMPSS